MALGQPLDIGSRPCIGASQTGRGAWLGMLNSRLPICAKTFIGAVFVVNSLAF